MSSHDTYLEKIRMVVAISKLCHAYRISTASMDELNRFTKFSTDLLAAVEGAQVSTFSAKLPESAFAAKGKL